MKATNKLIEVETGYKWEVRDARDRLRSEIVWSEWEDHYYVTAGSPEVPFFKDFEEALKFAETCEYDHAFRDGWVPSLLTTSANTTHNEESSGGEKFARTLRDTFGASQGLNADWSYDAWPIGRGLWILDNEDGTFALVKRTTVGDEFVIEELGRIQP